MKGEFFPAHPRAVQRTAKRDTLLFVLPLGQDRNETFLWILRVFLSLSSGREVWLGPAWFCSVTTHATVSKRNYCVDQRSKGHQREHPRFPCTFFLNVFFSRVTPGTQALSATPCILPNPNPLVRRAVRWLATIQMVNNRNSYYAAINLVNYIVTQVVLRNEALSASFFFF